MVGHKDRTIFWRFKKWSTSVKIPLKLGIVTRLLGLELQDIALSIIQTKKEKSSTLRAKTAKRKWLTRTLAISAKAVRRTLAKQSQPLTFHLCSQTALLKSLFSVSVNRVTKLLGVPLPRSSKSLSQWLRFRKKDSSSRCQSLLGLAWAKEETSQLCGIHWAVWLTVVLNSRTLSCSKGFRFTQQCQT